MWVNRSNGSYFDWTYSLNTSSSIKYVKPIKWCKVARIARCSWRIKIKFTVSTWLTLYLGWWRRQIINICPGTPQWKHRRFAWYLYFSAFVNGMMSCLNFHLCWATHHNIAHCLSRPTWRWWGCYHKRMSTLSLRVIFFSFRIWLNYHIIILD